MGSKHQKKRFMIVTYRFRPGGKFDELVEFSKKKLGSGKVASAMVVLDMVNKEVLKCTLPNTEGINIPYENIYKHYSKWYQDVMLEFENS
jgi:hypothetical protein